MANETSIYDSLFTGFGINDNGFKFPTFLDFLNIMNELGKMQFGEDFYIDNKTNLGQWFEMFCYTLEGQSKLFQTIYNNLSIYTMKGVMLDKYGSNFNVGRLTDTYAYATVEVTGVPFAIIMKGYKVKSKQGRFYSTVTNIELDSTGHGLGQVIAEDSGVAGNVGINMITEKVTPNEQVYTITNITSASGGADIESDIDYRARLLQFFLGSENGSVNGIRRAMLSLPQVKDCKVFENNGMFDDPATGLKPGQIAVIINGLIDEVLAYKLFNTRSAGVCTTGNTEIEVVSDSGAYVTERFYSAEEKPLYIKVSDITLANSEAVDIQGQIKQSLLTRLGQYSSLGNKVNFEKVQACVYILEDINEAKVEISIDNATWYQADLIPTIYEYYLLTEQQITIED